MNNSLLEAKDAYIIYVNGIGDHILSLPTFRAFSKLFNGRISIICKTGYGQLFFRDIKFRRIIEVPFKAEGETYVFDYEHFASQIGPCDLLISLMPWDNEDVKKLFYKLNPKESIGYCSYFKHFIDIQRIEHASITTFEAALLIDSNLKLEEFSFPPPISESNLEISKQVKAAYPKNAKVMILHGDTVGDKVWHNQRYYPVLDKLLDKYPNLYVLVIGKQFLSFTKCKLRARINRDFYDIPLETTFAILKYADYFLGVDSCFLHVADLFKIPSVGIFGPTSEIEWGFKWARHVHVKSPTDNMCDIQSDDVYNALEQIFHPQLVENHDN